MSRSKRPMDFEGKDIMYYLEHPDELERLLDGVVDDELTRGRIRTIYVKMKYGQTSARELAEYYDLPVQLIKDIASGKVFGKITSDI